MKKAQIFYADIGDYLTREQKLKILKDAKSIENIKMTEIHPNDAGDWINQRNDEFAEYIALGDKDDKNNNKTFFVACYSNGLKTQRDAWCYNSSKEIITKNIKNSIDFYNDQRKKLNNKIIASVDYDSTKFSWTRATLNDISKNKVYSFDEGENRLSCYRPFFKQTVFYYRPLNEMMYQIPKLFPDDKTSNLVLCVQGLGSTKEYMPLISNCIPDLGFNSGCQCFPLYWYEERKDKQLSLEFDDAVNEERYIRHDGITDWILKRARGSYGKSVQKEDIFYYVYGFLHSKEFRETYASDLKKMLPRIPLVDKKEDFWAFCKAGRKLAQLHLNYETVEPMKGLDVKFTENIGDEYEYYSVEKLRFPSKDKKETIIYNSHISISGIPEKAYEYVVNGKSAIEWIMDRYQVTVDKDSGIKNDCNDWAKEHKKPRYIYDFLLSIINVSCQTVDIVNNLPKIDFGKTAKKEFAYPEQDKDYGLLMVADPKCRK